MLPLACDVLTPCTADDIQMGLDERLLVDFDQRQTFDQALSSATLPPERLIALTYDDTTVTRGRLSDLVGVMIIKPPCRELLRHPALAGSEQL
jgi:hypothetical protein